MGLEHYVCDELPWGDPRDAARVRRGRALAARLVHRRHAVRDARALDAATAPVRNLVLLTTPIDTDGLALHELGRARLLRRRPGRRRLRRRSPGGTIDFANKMMKPVTNYWTTYRQLWEGVLERQGPKRRRLPADGQVGGRQPAVPGARLPRVDHLDVQGEPARARAPAPARASASTSGDDRAEPARRHRRRRPHRAAAGHRAAARPRLAARTSRTSTAPAGTSA